MRAKSEELVSPIIAIKAVADHVHVAVCISPGIAVGKWVGQVKGAASHAVNIAFGDLETPFRWQDGYGVLTFGAKNLNLVTDYIARQKEHHAKGTIQDYLEQSDDKD